MESKNNDTENEKIKLKENEKTTKDFLSKKKKRNSQSKKKKNKSNGNNDNNNDKSNLNNNSKKSTKNNFSKIEELYQKSRKLYEEFSKNYDLDKINLNDKANREKKWTHEIMKTGTFEDKISSLVLYIKKSPKETIKYLEILLNLSSSKNRKNNESVLNALKELFLNDILLGKKYLSFTLNYKNYKEKNSDKLNDEMLINFYYEDKIHNLYSRYISVLENNIIYDPLVSIKKKNMYILYEMIVKQPEGEEKILSALVNKLGDPQTEVTSYAIKLLKDLQKTHMKMSLVIFNSAKSFFLQNINTSLNEKVTERSKLYSLIFMTQMEIPRNFPEFLEENIKFFFDLFNKFSNIEKEEIKKTKKINKKNSSNSSNENDKNASNEKYLSFVIKRINILFNYVKNQKNNMMTKVNDLINEKIDVLFKFSHNKSLKLSIEILKFLFSLINTQDESFSDRYYKSLYDIIANLSLCTSKNVQEALKLILLSLINDEKINRVCAFIKRLLEMSLVSEPNYIICILIIISQVIRNKNKLWKIMEKNQSINIKNNNNNQSDEDKNEDNNDSLEKYFYDPQKRDPQFANGEKGFFNELNILKNHYHPSVQRISKFILENYKKDIVNYDGNPLVDFSLANFLEKFILKNPKIKSIKKEKKNNNKELTEDEEAQKFLNEEEIKNPNQIDMSLNDNLGTDDFKFISKFNKDYPKLTNNKNYLKKLKKQEAKNLLNDEDIDEENINNKKTYKENMESKRQKELERYADKVIQKEYDKIKDIDDDEEDQLNELSEEYEENDDLGEEEDDIEGEEVEDNEKEDLEMKEEEDDDDDE